MVAGRTVRKTGRGKVRTRSASAPIVVTDEERRHLVEDIAYFHAEKYRRVDMGPCREQDRRDAEAEIGAVLRRRRKR